MGWGKNGDLCCVVSMYRACQGIAGGRAGISVIVVLMTTCEWYAVVEIHRWVGGGVM